ncbi:thioesterase family protein [Aquamicrobium ahrensii]
MYVWARLARTMATAKSRGDYQVGTESRLVFRCLPTDIDLNLHLNNARYMMLADVGRIDLFMRSGLGKMIRQRKWAPMLGGLQTVFVREIRLWQRFHVYSAIETWQGTQALGRHRFVLESGETAATVMTTAGVYDRPGRRFLQMDEVVCALGGDARPRPLDEDEKAFLASHVAMRSAARGRS